MNHQQQQNQFQQKNSAPKNAQGMRKPSPAFGDPAAMHPVRRQRTQKNQRKMQTLQGVIIAVISLVLVVGILLLTLPMLKVKEIVVVGDSSYSREEIIEATGISVGDELLSVAFGSIDEVSFYEACPSVRSIKVSCRLSRVTITVEE